MSETTNYWDFVKNMLKQHKQMPKIQPTPRYIDIPLTVAQQRLWILQQMDPNNTAYNMFMPLKVKGDIDVNAFDRAVNEVIKRHESLRTVFAEEEGSSYQKILPELKIKTEIKDFRSSQDERYKLAFEWIMNETERPFDLAKGPLIRWVLARVDDQESYLSVIMHHIISDGFSVSIMYNEISSFYDAFTRGRNINLPELPVQYADFTIWQRSIQKKKFLKTQLEYWQKKLPKDIRPLELPTDRKRQASISSDGKMHRIIIPQEIVNALKELRAKEEGVTLFMILVAAFRVLLYLYSGQEDIIIGSPLANRNRREIKDLIGFFVNMVALYTDISDNPTFMEVLKREKKTCLEAYENQDIPFEYLMDELNIKRELGRNPLFQVALSFQSITDDTIKIGDAIVEKMNFEKKGAMFDITLLLYDRGHSVDGWIEYSTALFNADTIERFSEHFINLLSEVAENSNKRLFDIQLLSKDEFKRIVKEWNNTQAEYSEDLCIHQMFEAQVEKTPDAVALFFEGKELTYKELNRRANRLANYLIELGVKNNTFVGICMERSFEMIVGLLAILKAGGAYLPLDPSYPCERIDFMLKDLKVDIVLTQERLLEKLSDDIPQRICLDIHEYLYEKQTEENPNVKVDSDNLAYVIYTSGTTGKPKGVMVCHKPVINLIEWVNKTFNINTEDRLLFVTSICFDLSVYDIFGILGAGGTVHIPPEASLKDPEQILSILCENRITFWDSAPAALSQLVPFLSRIKEGSNTTNLRLAFLSGDWIPVSLPDSIRNVFKNAQVISLGGATEATIWSNYYVIGEVNPEWSSIPYGKPIQNAKYYILDKNMKPCPIGVPGDLYIGGDCLALGYANQLELTKKKFIPNIFSDKPGAKMYHTGDKARFWSDGTMEFIGRVDNQVKIRGFRIELDEVQTVLGQYPKLANVAVIAKEMSAGDKRLVAFVVPKDGNSITSAELREFLRTKLPEYMIPSSFIMIDRIPITTNGKLDRNALLEYSPSKESTEEHVAPVNKAEETLTKIWSELLGIDVISTTDNLFDLGGHSLLVAQMVLQVKQQMDIEISVKDIFTYPTIKELANQIVNGAVEERFVDLETESSFDFSLEIAQPGERNEYEMENILLTGSTGFIGRFLLHELLCSTDAKIYCLLKGNSEEEAFDRQKQILVSNGLWKEEYANRIIALPGDLSRPRFGLNEEKYMELARTIDVIYHNGANANYLGHYSRLKDTNVNGTKEVVRLAGLYKVKPIHFSSTLTVFRSAQNRVVNEDTPIEDEKHNYFPGYFASKWVAEKVVHIAREHGIPCNIYRFGLMLGDTELGRYDKNQWCYQLIKSFILLGYSFDKMPDLNHAVLPVDVAVRGLVSLSLKKELYNRNFYLCKPNRIPVQSFVHVYNKITSKPIKIVSFYEWLKIASAHVDKGNAVPFLPFVQNFVGTKREEVENYINDESRKLDIDNAKTFQEFENAGIRIPELDEQLVAKYFRYIVQNDEELKIYSEYME
ncbi:MAG TPA: amino acid adenylation domain-containing protein [Clostridium sp.]|nr:amino acid adenylation domain-containing protein [Clostridium sp.]